VPAEFWKYAIGRCRALNPEVVFLGESIDPGFIRSRHMRQVSEGRPFDSPL
jgi:hypothetical protein